MSDTHSKGSKPVHLNFNYLMNFSMTFTVESVSQNYFSPGKPVFPTLPMRKNSVSNQKTAKDQSEKESHLFQSGSKSPSSPMSPLSSSSDEGNEILYLCHPCSLTFSHLSQLETHEAMIHSHLLETENKKKRKTMESNFKNECTRCGKRFRDAYGLRRHFNSHINQRSIICNYCNKRFIELNDLNIHLRVHTGEKPYECSICNQRYRQKGHLLSHYRTHTGEKPYSCQKCGKCFSTSSGLLKHQRSREHCNEKERHIVEVLDTIF